MRPENLPDLGQRGVDDVSGGHAVGRRGTARCLPIADSSGKTCRYLDGSRASHFQIDRTMVCAGPDAGLLLRSDDAVERYAVPLWSFRLARGNLEVPEKLATGASNPGWETMIRPICAVLAITCLSAPAFAETCVASRYGYGGGRTASGERMNPNAMTAAHRARPFGSHVTVTSHSTGRSVTVRINDRGPFVRGRCIDLSTGAARVLGIGGTAMVSLR
jgi:rare lipoprotein A